MPVTLENLEPGGGIGTLGEGTSDFGPGDAYFGQTFVAAGYGMHSLTYFIQNIQDTDFRYHLLITTVEETPTGVRPGRVIKEVSGLAEPGEDFFPEMVTVDLSGIRLEKGETYAFILDSRAAWDGEVDAVFVGINSLKYLDGEMMILKGPYTASRETDFEQQWNYPADNDFRFSASFSEMGDTITGNKKNNKLNGTSDDDMMDGKKGNDTLKGKDGFDTLIGGKNKDTLRGGDDGDVLIGGKHRDKLYGDDGYNCYVFDFKMTKKSAKQHWDKLYDYNVGMDEIHLKQQYFSDLELGEVTPGDPNLEYKKSALFYDGKKFVKFMGDKPSSIDQIDIVVVA